MYVRVRGTDVGASEFVVVHTLVRIPMRLSIREFAGLPGHPSERSMHNNNFHDSTLTRLLKNSTIFGSQSSAAPASADESEQPAEGGPLNKRAIAFGPWTVSDIWKHGKFIGWGANCNQHFGTCFLNGRISFGWVHVACALHIHAHMYA